MRGSKESAGSTCNRRSRNCISLTALALRTESFASRRIGRMRLSPMTDCAALGAQCRVCPTTGQSTRTPTKITRSSLRPRRPETSSIRASLRRRLRCSREQRPEVLINPSDAARLGLSQGDVVQLGQRARPDASACAHIRGREVRASWSAKASGRLPPFLTAGGSTSWSATTASLRYGGVAFHDVSVWARRA